MSKVLTNIGITDFEQSALTYRKELLMMPIIGIQSSLKHMTLRPGVRYAERVGQPEVDIELAPYVANKHTDANLTVAWRELKTYFGSVNADFEPNAAISTILGHLASQANGDALKNTPLAKLVLALMSKQIGQKLNNCLFNAVRKDDGTKTVDLFDGFDTITAKEIAAGKISAEKGNLLELDTVITSANCLDVIKAAVFSCEDELRDQSTKLYVSRGIYDMYNESYQTLHGALPYNTEYKKTFVEGTDNMVELCPLVGKKNSPFIHLTTQNNMLVGVDQTGDMERVNVGKYSPDLLTYEMRMFFGCEFETIDKRMFKVFKLKAAQTDNAGEGAE